MKPLARKASSKIRPTFAVRSGSQSGLGGTAKVIVQERGRGRGVRAAERLNVIHEIARPPAETLQLTGESSLFLAPLRGIPRGRHAPLKLERRRLDPVGIDPDRFLVPPLLESISQTGPGLLCEFLSAMRFVNPELQLNERIRRQERAGPMIKGTAADATQSETEHQQNRGGPSHGPMVAGLTNDE